MQNNLENTGLNSIPFIYECDSDNSDYRLIMNLIFRSFIYKIKVERAKNVRDDVGTLTICYTVL